MYTLILDSMLFRTSGCPFIVLSAHVWSRSGIRFVLHVSFGEFLAADCGEFACKYQEKKTKTSTILTLLFSKIQTSSTSLSALCSDAYLSLKGFKK
jgi:hypothetical protein